MNHSPKTITSGRKTLYICPDGVYRALGRPMWAYRAKCRGEAAR